MSRYSQGLARKLTDLNGNYQPDFMAIGRLAVIIGNPYSIFPGLSDTNRLEMAKIIRGDKEKPNINSLSEESFRVAYNFINVLLVKKHDIALPYFLDESAFKRVNNYCEYLSDLVKMRKSTASSSAKDNMDLFVNSKCGGIFKGKLEEQLIMKSYEPKSGPVVRVSFRTKTRSSFIEKTLERFITFDSKIVQKTYYEPEIGKHVSGKEIFLDYFRRFKESGLDLYEFHSKENPNYLSNGELDDFKKKFIALFPIDHDGGKIVVKTKTDARYLAEDFFKNEIFNFAGFPIHLRLSENDLEDEEKDGALTLGVGSMLTHSGMTEIKIQHSSAKIESEFGKKMHILYKDQKRKKLINALKENNDYRKFYSNLCHAFQVEPVLFSESGIKDWRTKPLICCH